MRRWERILLYRMKRRVSETSYYMSDAPSKKILGQFGSNVQIEAYTDVAIIVDPHAPPSTDLLKRIFDFLPQCNSIDRTVQRTIHLVHEHIGGTPYKKTVQYTWGPRISRKIAEDMLAHVGRLNKNATVDEILELQILRKLRRISTGIFFFLSGRELDEGTGEKIKSIFSDLRMKNAWAIHTDSSKPMANENIWIINWKNQIFGTPLKRRRIKMSSNFVEIVGFQLEKVHTGMIQWILEADPKIVSDADKCKILNELTGKNSNFSPPLNCNIKVTREESLRRGIRADLFIELGEPSKTIIVGECKTDSDIDLKQLERTKKDFGNEYPGYKHYYCLILFGPSQFTSRKSWPEIRKLPFTILDLDNLIQIFSQCSINEHHFGEWIEALKKERDRISEIEGYLKPYNKFEDSDYWKSKGYRLWFSLYYCVYGKLLEHFQATQYRKWQANSGSNNPVLNLYQDRDRIPVKIPNSNLCHELIWEFNKAQFKLKAKLGIKKTMSYPKWWNNWQKLRDDIITVCNTHGGRNGRAAKSGRGEWVSVYQWDFDFCKQPLTDIVSETVSIIDTIKPQLLKI